MKRKTIWMAVSVLVVLGLLIGGIGCAQEAPAPGPAPTKTIEKTVEKTVTVTPAPEVYTLKYAHFAPENTDTAATDTWWAKEVERRTEGRVKFEFFYSASLVKAPDVLKALKAGIADVACVAAAYFPADLPLNTLFMAPYLSMKPDAITYAGIDLYQEFPEFRAEYEAHNCMLIHYYGIPPNLICGAGEPIKTLEDMKGKRIRAVTDVAIIIEMLGGVPDAIAIGETYGALERGLLDAVSAIYMPYVVATKIYEQSDWVMDPRMGAYHLTTTAINLDTLNSLPPEIQRIMEEVTAEVPDKYVELMADMEEDAWKTLNEAGIELYRLDKAEAERWKDKCTPEVWDQRIEAVEKQVGPVARTFFERYKELLMKYDAQSKYKLVFEKYLGN